MIFNGKKEMFGQVRLNIFGFRDICKEYERGGDKEIGGVFYGTNQFDKVIIDDLIPVKNAFIGTDEGKEKYKADAKDVKRLRNRFFDLMVQGKKFLGEYHSHPSGSILPSKEDVENIYTNKLKNENYILGIIVRKKSEKTDYVYYIHLYCFHKNYSNYKQLGVWEYDTAAERIFINEPSKIVMFVKRIKTV